MTKSCGPMTIAVRRRPTTQRNETQPTTLTANAQRISPRDQQGVTDVWLAHARAAVRLLYSTLYVVGTLIYWQKGDAARLNPPK